MTQLNRSLTLAVMALAASLAGCERQAAPEPKPDPSPAATATEQVSIIRPELETEPEPPLLDPLNATVSFAEPEGRLTDKARRILDEVAASPQMAAGRQVTISGHTDSTGTDTANLRVSQRRAEMVRDYLIERGVAADRIRIVALGEMRPVRPNAHPDGTPDEQGRAANRRVEIVVAVPQSRPASSPAPEEETLAEQAAEKTRE